MNNQKLRQWYLWLLTLQAEFRAALEAMVFAPRAVALGCTHVPHFELSQKVCHTNKIRIFLTRVALRLRLHDTE